LNAATDTVEKPDAVPFLQGVYRSADRGLGQVQCFCGTRDMLTLRYRQKYAKLIKSHGFLKAMGRLAQYPRREAATSN